MLADGFHEVPKGKIAVVVTHLEMSAPAPLRGAALPTGLRFEPLVPDLPSYRDLFRRVGEDWLWFSRLRLDDATLAGILSDPQVKFWTLSRNNQPEALLELDFRVAGRCELAYFGLTKALIGCGAGAYLMDRAIENAWAADISRFTVHTCTADSPAALPFYIRSGFEPHRQQIEIADDPRLTGDCPDNAAPHVPIFCAEQPASQR